MNDKEIIKIIKRCYEHKYSTQKYDSSVLKATFEDMIINAIEQALSEQENCPDCETNIYRIHDLEKQISELQERLEEESYVVCDRGETIHKLQAWYDNLKKDNDSLNEDILKLQAEIEKKDQLIKILDSNLKKGSDVWWMKEDSLRDCLMKV